MFAVSVSLSVRLSRACSVCGFIRCSLCQSILTTFFITLWYDLNNLAFSYSFGYDSTRVSNLQILDKETLVYVAGAYLVLMNIKTSTQKYLQALGRVCFGAVTVSIM